MKTVHYEPSILDLHCIGICTVYRVESVNLLVQTKTDSLRNSVDQNETAHYESSHLDLHCLPFHY